MSDVRYSFVVMGRSDPALPDLDLLVVSTPLTGEAHSQFDAIRCEHSARGDLVPLGAPEQATFEWSLWFVDDTDHALQCDYFFSLSSLTSTSAVCA